MSRTLVFIVVIVLVGLVLFAGLLYYTLKTQITDVSSKKPYSEYIGKKVYSKRDAIIALSSEADAYANPYIITESKSDLMLEADPRYKLSSGTELLIQSAKIFKNGTSGFEHAFVLGTVFVKELNREVPFEYRWGEAHTSLYNEYEDYWTFSLSLWQEEEQLIGEKFYLK